MKYYFTQKQIRAALCAGVLMAGVLLVPVVATAQQGGGGKASEVDRSLQRRVILEETDGVSDADSKSNHVIVYGLITAALALTAIIGLKMLWHDSKKPSHSHGHAKAKPGKKSK